jgi:hypothetical protein
LQRKTETAATQDEAGKTTNCVAVPLVSLWHFATFDRLLTNVRF